MARKTPAESNAAAQDRDGGLEHGLGRARDHETLTYYHNGTQRRLTDAMLSLGHSIDKQRTGPKRLEMLRAQASLSDKRELLRSARPH